jgi:hypothetical protein
MGNSKPDGTGPQASAPDLEIFGDQVTLHPSGFVAPPDREDNLEKEKGLIAHQAKFRKSPLE